MKKLLLSAAIAGSLAIGGAGIAQANNGKPPAQACGGLLQAYNSPGKDHRSPTATEQLDSLIAYAECQAD